MTTHPLSNNKRSEDLNETERKMDFFTHQLDNLNFERLAKRLIESIQSNPSYSDRKSKAGCFKKDSRFITPILEQRLETHYLQFEALLSIYNSLPNLKLLPSTRGWAGSPDFLAKIVEIILKGKPKFVLEAGSGVSSIIIGLALKLNNYGKALSLDHDKLYAKTAAEYIEVNEIVNISEVTHCPLREYNNLGQPLKWYETDNLNLTDKIDLLIIDGPPRYTHYLARYPAVPLLHTYFSDRMIILLDDANRNDEIITVQKWLEFLKGNNFKVTVTEFNHFEKGMMVLEVCRLS